MFLSISKLNVKKQILGIALTASTVLASLSVFALEEVQVTGTPGDGWGLEYHRYLSNQITADQLRALYEAMAARAAAEALAAAQKAKSEEERIKTEREQCEARAVTKNMLCLRDSVSYKSEQNKPCHILQATVGNIPHANPAGACYARVLDQYDLFKANCELFHATNMYACIK